MDWKENLKKALKKDNLESLYEIKDLVDAEINSQEIPVCKHCGCTDEKACIQNNDEPCHWVIIDGNNSVCSACDGESMLKQQDKCGLLDS